MATPTTTSTLSEFINAAMLKAADDEIAEHLFFPGCPCASIIRTVDLTTSNAVAAKFSKYNALTAGSLTEGQDYTTTQALDPSSTTITATEVGVQGVVTDMAWKAIQDPNARASYAQDVARNHVKAIMTKYDTDIMALFPALDSGYTNTGANITNANVLEAVDACAKANMPKPWFGFLHPQQHYDLLTENNSVFLDASKSADVARDVYGKYFVGTVYGVQWFVSTNVPTANAGADRAGAILSGAAIGSVFSKMPITSTEHDQSLRGDEVLTVCEYGVAEIDGTMGMYLITDA